jgi:hypothetical protein
MGARSFVAGVDVLDAHRPARVTATGFGDRAAVPVCGHHDDAASPDDRLGHRRQCPGDLRIG